MAKKRIEWITYCMLMCQKFKPFSCDDPYEIFVAENSPMATNAIENIPINTIECGDIVLSLRSEHAVICSLENELMTIMK